MKKYKWLICRDKSENISSIFEIKTYGKNKDDLGSCNLTYTRYLNIWSKVGKEYTYAMSQIGEGKGLTSYKQLKQYRWEGRYKLTKEMLVLLL